MKSVSREELAPWIRRDKSVCQIVIASGEPLVVGDMQTDPRLAGHPLVPHLPYKFYAGVPLLTQEGEAIASLQAHITGSRERRLVGSKGSSRYRDGRA